MSPSTAGQLNWLRNARPALLAAAFALCLAPGFAQTNPAPPKADANAKSKPAPATPPAAAADETDDRIIIEHVDTLKYDPQTKIYHLRGNVVFANKDVKLYCDEADYNEDTDTAKARGHLRITDPNSVITGDLIDADFGKDLAIITGNVKIVTQKKGAKPADKAGADKEPERVKEYWEKQTTITCERVEYYYSDDVKKMIATPRVKAVQEDKTVWADRAVHEDIPGLVTLTGNVQLTTEKGDEFRCAKAVISVEEDWIQAEGMSGVTLRKKKSQSEQPAPPAEKPAAEPAPTAPAAAPTPPAKPEGSQ